MAPPAPDAGRGGALDPAAAPLSTLDWLVVAADLGGSMTLGLALARRGTGSMVEFFVGGRTVPWWLAATSMAATTFNVDTPLYVAGLVARFGVAGNWEWWSFAFAHVLLAVLLARLWRRVGVLTDAELVEIRYAGRPAAALRATRAFIFAVPLNCIGIGYGMLAMRKVILALGLLQHLPNLPGDPRLWAVLPVVAITLLYTTVSGLWGVVATDFLQYILAMAGAVVVMIFAVHEVGGLSAMTAAFRARGMGNRLAVLPTASDALLPFTTFLGYIGIQWWAFKNSDGGGMFIQRLSSTANEREATRAAHLFNILNYVVRTWPWVLVGLAALLILPGLADPELAYPMLMARYLPSGILGLVFASLLAAFMSSVSTQINWGASYVVHDLYARFTGQADERLLLRAARVASVGITILAAALSFYMVSVGQVFRILILVGTGTGLILLLRWFWWRINAWAEITALVAGLLLAGATIFLPALRDWSFGAKLCFTTFGSMALWLPVLWLTPAEPAERLDAFYLRARPPGAWGPVRARTGLAPLDSLARAARDWLIWVTVILGGTVGV
ncbi:MAG: sodium:solute symporter family protein, partial [Gemmatimonadales bacterium]